MSARRGSSSAASRSESSSPAASSSSAREGTRPVEELFHLGLRHRADELVDHGAVAEGLHRRDPLHAEARRQRLVGVDVDLGQDHLAAARAASAASSAGVSVRHGPHHSAQKSTTTGTARERSITSLSKLASLTSTGMRAG